MSAIYPTCRTRLLNGDLDLSTAPLAIALVGEDFTYDPAHEYKADLTGLYSAPARELTVTSVADGIVYVDPVVFPDVVDLGLITGVVVYGDDVPESAGLIAWVDRRADTVPISITPNAGDITMAFSYLLRI